MKRVLLDTNIILDIILKRQPYFEVSSKIFNLIDNYQILGHITASTVTDIYYISRKEKGREIARQFISNLIEIVEILGVNKNTIIHALESNLKDFEDAVQLSAAKINKIEIIVTRNKTDFDNSTLKIMTPDELIKELE